MIIIHVETRHGRNCCLSSLIELLNNLREALHCFTQEEVQNAMTPIEDERSRLEVAHRRCMAFFEDVDIDDLETCLQTLEDEEK